MLRLVVALTLLAMANATFNQTKFLANYCGDRKPTAAQEKAYTNCTNLWPEQELITTQIVVNASFPANETTLLPSCYYFAPKYAATFNKNFAEDKEKNPSRHVSDAFFNATLPKFLDCLDNLPAASESCGHNKPHRFNPFGFFKPHLFNPFNQINPIGIFNQGFRN